MIDGGIKILSAFADDDAEIGNGATETHTPEQPVNLFYAGVGAAYMTIAIVVFARLIFDVLKRMSR